MSGVHFGLGAFVVVLPGLALPAMAQPCLHDWAPVTIPARVSHAMAYDSDRDVVVCVGGLDSETACRTWEYDGESWSLLNAGGAGNPSSRQDWIRNDTSRSCTAGQRIRPDLKRYVGVERADLDATKRERSGRTARSRDGVRRASQRDGSVRRIRHF